MRLVLSCFMSSSRSVVCEPASASGIAATGREVSYRLIMSSISFSDRELSGVWILDEGASEDDSTDTIGSITKEFYVCKMVVLLRRNLRTSVALLLMRF